MDGFSYTNIFDTKGIEYLVVIAFLLLLIPFWLALNRQAQVKEYFRRVLGVLTDSMLRIPQGIFYSKNHTWAYLEKSGVARIGLDDLIIHITGDVKIKQLMKKGDIIKKGDLIAEMDQNGKSLSIFSPISGEMISENPLLNTNQLLLAEDPYGSGWICSVKPSAWVKEISTMYLAGEATEMLKKDLVRYKDFLAAGIQKYSPEPAMVLLQDGGELSENSLSEMPEGLWKDFQKEFLNP